jgi:predicted RNase H-like nuclease
MTSFARAYAWCRSRMGEGSDLQVAKETGVVALEQDGRIDDADWTVGVAETVSWIQGGTDGDTLLFVDAPLVVTNATGQRACERQVGQRFGRWKVSANSTNLGSPRQAGITVRQTLERAGWVYDDGRGGPPTAGCSLSEYYPHTTLVGVPELGYDLERPLYKRKPRSMPIVEWRTVRAQSCDDLISRLDRLSDADPPLLLTSHPATALLVEEGSPTSDSAYKHREDLIDAVLCAWMAQFWMRHGIDRCEVLGESEAPDGVAATIIAPAKNEIVPHVRLTLSSSHTRPDIVRGSRHNARTEHHTRRPGLERQALPRAR